MHRIDPHRASAENGSTILFVHESPGALGGSERAMLLAAVEHRRRGRRLVLLHGQRHLTGDVARAFDALVATPTLFRRPHPRTARSWVGDRAVLRRAVKDEAIDLAHCHLWGHWVLVRELRRLVPTVATASLAVCPNGARYRYGVERTCERPFGGTCLTWGHRTQGCGHTADERPFGPLAMGLAILETRAQIGQLRLLQQVIAPSTWQLERLVADGVPRRNVTVVAPPITRVERTTTPPPVPRVAVACRLVRAKGVHRLLAASAAMTTVHDLDIVGSGPARPALERQARDLGLADRVRFHGRLEASEVSAVMGRATVVVMPSLLPETFGMSGAEAAAAGIRVVAYHHSGIRDWIDGGGTGVPVDGLSVDALVRGLEHALSSAPAPLRQTSRQFDVGDHTTALDAVYSSALRAA